MPRRVVERLPGQALGNEISVGSAQKCWEEASDLAAQYVVYTIETTRCREVLIRLLGSVFQGILSSGRFGAYLKYHKGRTQFCWAHLKRNIRGVLELTKNSADRPAPVPTALNSH